MGCMLEQLSSLAGTRSQHDCCCGHAGPDTRHSAQGVGDSFLLFLTDAACLRLAPLAGDPEFGVTRAMVAVESDAAAPPLVVSKSMAHKLNVARHFISESSH